MTPDDHASSSAEPQDRTPFSGDHTPRSERTLVDEAARTLLVDGDDGEPPRC